MSVSSLIELPTGLQRKNEPTRRTKTYSPGAIVNRGNAIPENVHQLLIHIWQERSVGKHADCMYMRLPAGRDWFRFSSRLFLNGSTLKMCPSLIQHVRMARTVSCRNFCFSYTSRNNEREWHSYPSVHISSHYDRSSLACSCIRPDQRGWVQIECAPFSLSQNRFWWRENRNRIWKSNQQIRTKAGLSVHFLFGCHFSASFVQTLKFVAERR